MKTENFKCNQQTSQESDARHNVAALLILQVEFLISLWMHDTVCVPQVEFPISLLMHDKGLRSTKAYRLLDMNKVKSVFAKYGAPCGRRSP